MGMSMHLQFFRAPNDEHLQRKLDAGYACEAAGVDLPDELLKYLAPIFEEYGGLPQDRATAIDAMLSMGPARKQQEEHAWSEDMAQGFEVDLAELPPGVAKIRFYCSW